MEGEVMRRRLCCAFGTKFWEVGAQQSVWCLVVLGPCPSAGSLGEKPGDAKT